MNIKDIRALTGLNRTKFCEKYGIPVRSCEDWENGVRTPPNYVVSLLERVVKLDFATKRYKAVIAYELDDGEGAKELVYDDIIAKSEPEAYTLAYASFTLDKVRDTVNRVITSKVDIYEQLN